MSENITEKRSFSDFLKGVILIERFSYSAVIMVFAVAGYFLANLGDIGNIEWFTVVKVGILFWMIHSTSGPVNDYFDRNADRIGRPNAPIPAGLLTVKEAKVIVIMNYVIGIIIIFALSPNNLTIIFASLHLLLGLIYSAPPIRMCKRPIGGFTTIAFGAFILPLLGGWAAAVEGRYHNVLLFLSGGFLLALITQRMPADIADMTGDNRFGRGSLPQQIGIQQAYTVALGCAIFGIILFIVAYFIIELNYFYLVICGVSSLLLLLTIFQFKKDMSPEIARKVSEKLMLPLLLFGIAIIVGSI